MEEAICEECGFYHLFASYRRPNRARLLRLAHLSGLSGLVCLVRALVGNGRCCVNGVWGRDQEHNGRCLVAGYGVVLAVEDSLLYEEIGWNCTVGTIRLRHIW